MRNKNLFKTTAFTIALIAGFFFFSGHVFAATTTTTSTKPMATTTSTIIDADNDGLSDDLEIKLGADPNNPDSDFDGYKDGEEVANGFNPMVGNRNKDVTRTVSVDLSKQQMFVYLNGVEIYKMPVSTGLLSMPTPIGGFKIERKVPTINYVGPGYNLPNTKWNLEFKKHYYLHGAYWHNQFGIRPMSHGCVNIAYVNAEKLYKFLQVGDEVKIFGKTPTKKLVLTK